VMKVLFRLGSWGKGDGDILDDCKKVGCSSEYYLYENTLLNQLKDAIVMGTHIYMKDSNIEQYTKSKKLQSECIFYIYSK
jgi:hypothetical protein